MTDPIVEAIGRCNPEEPLGPGDPRWHDFDAVRGSNLHHRLSRDLRGAEARRGYCHIALASQRGCGKSTELARVSATVRNEGYLPLYTVVSEEAGSEEIGFGDVFLLMLRMLETEFRANKRLKPLPEKTVKVVADWFRDVTQSQEQEIERAIAYQGEATLGPDTPLAKLLFGLTALRKTTGTQREEIRRIVEKYADHLRDNLNHLLDDARKIAKEAYPRGLLFILDNLDRYPPDMIDNAVLKRSDLFNGVNAHMIFVVPISLLHRPPSDPVGDLYQAETLPMITVFQREDPRAVNDRAIDEVIQAIFKRVDRPLFSDLALARELARLSGGCPRDLLRLLNESLLESNERIDGRAVTRAASILRGEMTRRLTRADFKVLAGVHLDGRIDPDEAGRALLFSRAALEYNGERWVGVHPLLWDTPEFKAALEEEKRRRGGILHET